MARRQAAIARIVYYLNFLSIEWVLGALLVFFSVAIVPRVIIFAKQVRVRMHSSHILFIASYSTDPPLFILPFCPDVRSFGLRFARITVSMQQIAIIKSNQFLLARWTNRELHAFFSFIHPCLISYRRFTCNFSFLKYFPGTCTKQYKLAYIFNFIYLQASRHLSLVQQVLMLSSPLVCLEFSLDWHFQKVYMYRTHLSYLSPSPLARAGNVLHREVFFISIICPHNPMQIITGSTIVLYLNIVYSSC